MTGEPTSDGLDPLIHEIARLRICAALAATTAVEAQTLKAAAGISDSALSKHLRRLAEAGYISQTLGTSRGPGRPRTWVSLTDHGRTAYTEHLAALQRLTQAPRQHEAQPGATPKSTTQRVLARRASPG